MSSLKISNSELNTLNNFSDSYSANNELKTQVSILKSPSVLMNVFEYVKAEK